MLCAVERGPSNRRELGSGNVANLCIRFIIPFSILGIDRLIWSATGVPYVGSILLLIPAGLLFLYYWPYLIANWDGPVRGFGCRDLSCLRNDVRHCGTVMMLNC